MLKVLGKYINNSGLDQAFEEPEIYGPATIEQIKIGKHMKRTFEANTCCTILRVYGVLSAFTHSLRKN